MVRSNIVQSIRYDSGHHKEFRKSPKITFHIRKVGFRISEKFQNFSIEYRNVLENSVGPMVGPLAPKVSHGLRYIIRIFILYYNFIRKPVQTLRKLGNAPQIEANNRMGIQKK